MKVSFGQDNLAVEKIYNMKLFKQIKEVFFFSQVDGLIKLGRNQDIEKENTIPLAEDIAVFQDSSIQSSIDWGSQKLFLKTLFWKLRHPLFFNFILLLIAQGISLLSPMLIHQFLAGLTGGTVQSTSHWIGIASIGFSIGLVGYFSGLFMQHYFHQNLKLGQKINSIINSKLFDHSIALNHQSRQKISVGDVVNHMSSDSESVADLSFVFIELIIDVLLILASIGMLFYYLGSTAWISVVLLLLLVPITYKMAQQFSRFDDQIMKHRDARLNLMGQILNSIRLIKYFVWEKSVAEEVQKVRTAEIAARDKIVKAESLSLVVYMAISCLVLLATLLTHSWREQEITLALVFTVISIFTLLEEPFGNLTALISRLSSGLVGGHRISEFVSLPVDQIPRRSVLKPAISIQNLNFTYDGVFSFQIPDLQVAVGQSVAVIGLVGSGKSTFIQILLRELKPQQGEIIYHCDEGITLKQEVPAATVFVPQDSYIINGSLRENLTFGTSEISEIELQNVLYLSCLESDVLRLEHGLATEIGEKGINLSGGQKQRVSLARATLKKPELILLDDPFAAVDVHTENSLCDRLLFGEWNTKTRIVVTHRLEHLERFDSIVLFDKGRMVAHGSYQQLKKHSPEFNHFYQSYQKSELRESVHDESSASHKPESKKQNLTASPSPLEGSHRVTEDEEKAIGSIKKDLYWSYLKLLGGSSPHSKWILLGLAMSAIITKLFPLIQKAWLARVDQFIDHKMTWFFVGYLILSLISLGLCYFNNRVWFKQGIAAAAEIHTKMLRSVLNAKIRFFDSTPVGRILQRFSRDQESMDVHLMFTHITAIDCFVQILISLVLIVVALPLMLFFIVPILGFYYRIQNDYRKVAREVKRLDSIARSPRFAHFKETLQGLTVLRSYGTQDWFRAQFWNHLLLSHKMFYNHYMVNRWFSARVPLIGGVIASLSALLLTWFSYRGYLGAGIAGLVMVYAMSFWRQLNWAIRIFSDIEARMTSVERLQFFCNLPQEKNIQKESALVPYHPIRSGHIEFRNLSVRYAAHLPLVLKNISFTVQSGERVGIIGPTGSGKSTLFQALYRFVDFETGSIYIDGQCIQSLKLEEVRKSLAIIPQDPILFLGTIRSNLDRYNEYSESELEAVLRKACLWELIESLPLGLQTPVIENGNNFSQGQRQLLCLARALLLKAKIIILDEATASVDIQTDQAIQHILDHELQGVTLLIIAHRLETLKNSHQIIQLSGGQLTKLGIETNFDGVKWEKEEVSEILNE